MKNCTLMTPDFIDPKLWQEFVQRSPNVCLIVTGTHTPAEQIELLKIYEVLTDTDIDAMRMAEGSKKKYDGARITDPGEGC
eukprot:1034872-Amphidinium_carterae.1